jgi:hypothetical protein
MRWRIFAHPNAISKNVHSVAVRTAKELLDYLVNAREHGRRDGEAERLGSLEVDRKLVLRWRMYWKVGRAFHP